MMKEWEVEVSWQYSRYTKSKILWQEEKSHIQGLER